MPAQGALIYASDYTDVRRAVSKLLGDRILEYASAEDRAKYGYGQTVLSDSRSITREVSIVDDLDLAALRADVLKIATHCGLASNPLITSLPVINPGDLIDNAHLEAYLAAIPLLNSNRFALGANQFSDGPFATEISNSRTTPWGASWYYGENTVRHSFTIDFITPEKARYFFNSGGQIRFSASRTGGTTTPQNTVWTNLLESMGTIVFDYSSTTGASGVGSAVGFYDLTTAAREVFTKTAGSGAYASNDYTITMNCNVANNTYGEARYIYVNVYFKDDHTARYQVNDTVSGVLTSNVSIRRATGGVQVDIPNATNTVLLSS